MEPRRPKALLIGESPPGLLTPGEALTGTRMRVRACSVLSGSPLPPRGPALRPGAQPDEAARCEPFFP